MNDELISVIVPVYNVEKYLHRCIDSILSQTYNNLEIILVDDGSTDNSPDICDQYEKKDNRIIVIHKKNGGLSDARNKGISLSKGKYLLFLDSDDYIPQKSVEKLYLALCSSDADISAGLIQMVNDDFEKYVDNIYGNSKIITKEDALKSIMYMKDITSNAIAKLYKKAMFNDIKFPFGRYYEDLATTYKVIANADKVVVVNDIVYYYYQRSDSIMHERYSKKRLEGLKFALEQLKFVREKYPRVSEAAIYRTFIECIDILSIMPIWCSDKKKVFRILKKCRKYVIKDKNIQIKDRLLVFISIFGHLPIKIAFGVRNSLLDTGLYKKWVIFNNRH